MQTGEPQRVVKQSSGQTPPPLDKSRGKKNTDTVMVVAIAAALLAIASMLFSLMVNSRGEHKVQVQIEHPADTAVMETPPVQTAQP